VALGIAEERSCRGKLPYRRTAALSLSDEGPPLWYGVEGTRGGSLRRNALEHGARQYGAITATRVPRRSARRGTGGSRLEAVGRRPAQTPRRRSGQRAARSAARPAERPALRRRSGARPSSFSAGQRVFDCVFLQNVE
jgi:hypothetical protein